MCTGAGDWIVFLIPVAIITALAMSLVFAERNWKTGQKWLLIAQAVLIPIFTWDLAWRLTFANWFNGAYDAECNASWQAWAAPVSLVLLGAIMGAIPFVVDTIRKRAAQRKHAA
jgi:hypothetical protein